MDKRENKTKKKKKKTSGIQKRGGERKGKHEPNECLSLRTITDPQ